jgi:C4-type Zn-finger protein
MPLIFQLNDPCPKCRAPTMQAEIELYPTQADVAIHNFYCADCGPVKSTIHLTETDRSAV